MIPSPMTCTEEHEALINRRRYQRYEIDTQLQVTLLGLEQRGTLRGRSLNISEAGIAGVFVTVCWRTGPSRILSSGHEQPGPGRSGCVQSLRLLLRF